MRGRTGRFAGRPARPNFTATGLSSGRLGIFAARNGNSERAVILLLPAAGKPDRVNICITQGFGQATAQLDPLVWSNPLSPPFVNFVLLKHVINRWGAQTLASKKQMAFVYIVRAKGANELGPFANDGPFVRQVLTELVALTNDAFSFEHAEAFTFSSGISEFRHLQLPSQPLHAALRAAPGDRTLVGPADSIGRAAGRASPARCRATVPSSTGSCRGDAAPRADAALRCCAPCRAPLRHLVRPPIVGASGACRFRGRAR